MKSDGEQKERHLARHVVYKGGHNEFPSGPPPTEPPPAVRPTGKETVRQVLESHPWSPLTRDGIKKSVYEKLAEIHGDTFSVLRHLPKLGGQSATSDEAQSHKEILEWMRDASNDFFAEMLAHEWLPHGSMDEA